MAMNEKQLMEVVLESLLFSASPNLAISKERSPDVYVEVIAALKASSPDIFELIELDNIEILPSFSEEEMTFISNIHQLLGDIVKIADTE